MEEALGRVLATSPNLEALEDKSEWLVAQASTFRREARGIRRQLCCRNLRLACCLCIFLHHGHRTCRPCRSSSTLESSNSGLGLRTITIPLPLSHRLNN